MKRDDHDHSGKIFANRYEILNLLGSGGMGSVYFAKDRFLDGSLVAIKILHRNLSGNPEFVQRFLREVKAMRLVSHPNVVRNFETGEFDGYFFYTMECLRGVPLSELIAGCDKDNPMPWETIENIFKQICFGLQAIHGADLVHRDLKPDNLFLEDDDLIKITDFGVVRVSNSHLTQTHTILGTLDYVAPEVWNGSAPTKQSDIYSLGLVMYEIITGALPFTAESPAELMKLHLTVKPRPLYHARPDIPTWVDGIVQKMLAKTLKERPENVEAVLRLLESPRHAANRSSGNNPVVPNSSRRTLRSEEVKVDETSEGRTGESGGSLPQAERKASATASHQMPPEEPATDDRSVEAALGRLAKPETPSGGQYYAVSKMGVKGSRGMLKVAAVAVVLVSIISFIAFPKVSSWLSSGSAQKEINTK